MFYSHLRFLISILHWNSKNALGISCKKVTWKRTTSFPCIVLFLRSSAAHFNGCIAKLGMKTPVEQICMLYYRPGADILMPLCEEMTVASSRWTELQVGNTAKNSPRTFGLASKLRIGLMVCDHKLECLMISAF